MYSQEPYEALRSQKGRTESYERPQVNTSQERIRTVENNERAQNGDLIHDLGGEIQQKNQYRTSDKQAVAYSSPTELIAHQDRRVGEQPQEYQVLR